METVIMLSPRLLLHLLVGFNLTLSAVYVLFYQPEREVYRGYLPCALKNFSKLLPLSRNSTFQLVLPANKNFFVYSAYLRTTPSRMSYVLVIAIGRSEPIIMCSYFDVHANLYGSSIGLTQRMRDDAGQNLTYSSCFILCPVPSTKAPTFVAVSFPPKNLAKLPCQFSNLLRVEKSKQQQRGAPIEFSACVKPIYDYSDTFGLLEWIEFHRLMGVQHFTLYIVSMTKEARCAISSVYPKHLSFVDWNPPSEFNRTNLYANGMIAALNDCLYRYKGLARYVMFTDLDEFIVPNRTRNYRDMLALIHNTQISNLVSKTAYYRFTNGFFFKCWPDELPDFVQNENDGTLRKVMERMVLAKKSRLRHPLYHSSYKEYANRTKILVQTDLAEEIGNHLLIQGLPGCGGIDVDPLIAYMHHYRHCFQSEVNISEMKESSAFKYLQSTSRNILRQISNISSSCDVHLFT